MVTMQEWCDNQINKWPHIPINRDILEFIYRINSHSNTPEGSDAIESLFSAGYCYYFALMLKENFEGRIIWLKNRSHIIFMDENEVAYDNWGLYLEYLEEEVLPVEILGEALELFKHGKEYSWSKKKIREVQLELQKRINAYETEHGHRITNFYNSWYEKNPIPDEEE